jgi:multiple sugar transport system permease protein
MTTMTPPVPKTEKMSFLDHLARTMTWQRFAFALGMFIFIVMILFPFYWMVSSSFKSRAEIGGRNAVYVPSELRLDAYDELFNPDNSYFQNFGTNMRNSIFVAIPTSALTVVLSTLGAYAVARLRFKGKEILINSVLVVYLFPAVLLIIPLFAMLSSLSDLLGVQVQDNLPILIFTYLAQNLACSHLHAHQLLPHHSRRN